MKRADTSVECARCSRLPPRISVTNGNLGDFPEARELVPLFHTDESGALPEYKILQCQECKTCYVFSSHATITGGDYESADAYGKVPIEESAKLAEFLRWREQERPRDDLLANEIKSLLIDFLLRNRPFDGEALSGLRHQPNHSGKRGG